MIEPGTGFVRLSEKGPGHLQVRPGSHQSFFVQKKISDNSWLIKLVGQHIKVTSDVPLEVGKIFRALVLRQGGRVVLKLREPSAAVESVLERLSLPRTDQVRLILQAFIQQGLPLREELLQRAVLFFTSFKEIDKRSARFLALLYDKGIFPDRSLFERFQYLLREPGAFSHDGGGQHDGGQHEGRRGDEDTRNRREKKKNSLEELKARISEQMKREGQGESLLQLFNHIRARGDNWMVFPISFPRESVIEEGMVRVHTDPAGRTDYFTLSFYGRGEFHFRGNLSGGQRKVSFFMDRSLKSRSSATLISELGKKLHNLSFEIDDTIKGAEVFFPFEGEKLTTLKKIDTIV